MWITATLFAVVCSERNSAYLVRGRLKFRSSVNADQTVRLLARQNGVAKQQYTLLRQVSFPTRSGEMDRET